jgi:hypothetical protein
MSTTINGDTGVIFPDASTQSKAVSQATPFAVTASAIAGAELQLPEATANGVNYVAVKAPNTLAANTTFTLPSADGTNGQYLQTNGSGALAFASVPATTPGGTTGQIQINNAGAFGALSSGTTGQILTSGGAGAAPIFLAQGTTGQILTSAGAGAAPTFLAQGTTGQVLTSAGAGVAPTFTTLTPVPGATELYSIVTSGVNGSVASPSSITTATFYSQIRVNNGTANGAGVSDSCPIWSKYYSCWFGLGTGDSGTSSYNIYYSKDGINWIPYITDFYSKIGNPTSTFQRDAGAGYANIIVDDSNGRLWTFYTASDYLSITGYYKNAAAGMNSNWTSAGTVISLPYSAVYYGARYVDTGNSTTSAIVLLCSNSESDNRLYTCDAGGTTFTLRVTGSTPNSSNQPTSFTIDSITGRAAILYADQPRCMYMTTNNARTGWAYNTNYGGGSGSSANCTIGVGGGFYVTASGSAGSSNLFYSSTGAGTWTTITNPAASNTIQRVMYVNGVWYMTTLNGMYSTTQNPPTTGWTQISPSPRILGVINVRTQA